MTDDDLRHAFDVARAAIDYAGRWLAYRAWHLRVPGVQWAVWFDGAVQGGGAIGVADLVTGEPLTAEHRFRIASHSKMFTATAILRLVEQGRLRLDSPLSDTLPELADAPSGVGAVPLRDLLEHGGGLLRDGLDGDHWQHARPFPDERRLLDAVRTDGLKSEPGEVFAYSNLGYSLLGMVVARASGSTYRDAVRALVVDPIGLEHTAPDHDPTGATPCAAAHTGLTTSLIRRRIPHVDTGAMSAATGFASTAEDVVRFLAALRIGSGELLQDASKRLQQRPLRASGPEGDRHYGLGVISETVAGRRVVGHSGGYPGHITTSMLDPEDGIAVSVLTNAIDGPATELAAGVLAILDAALVRPDRLRLTGDPPADLGDTSRFEGRFADVWGVLDVVRLGDRLLALSPTGSDPLASPDELERLDDTTLRIAAGDGFGSVGETIRYEFDAAGRITRIRAGSGTTMWPFDVGDADAFQVPWPKPL